MTNKIQCWGKSETWYPTSIYTPESLNDLRELLAKAKEENLPVHVLGSAHSMNDIAVTPGIMIRTEKLCHVLNIDKEKMTIHVEGGIKIHDLLDVLIKEGLTLPNQGYILEQAIAGAIATSTHGSGQTGTLSSFVTSIELLDSNGKLHLLDPQTTPELFSAACVHLGCLGVIYTVKLKCVPLFKLELSKELHPLKDTLENLDQLTSSNPFFQICFDPYNKTMMLWKYKLTDKPPQGRWKYKLKRLLIKFISWLSFDSWAPVVFDSVPLGLKFFMNVAKIKSCVDFAPLILSPADEGHYIEIEIAVPYEHFKSALQDVQDILTRYESAGVRPISLLMLRFVEADTQGFMSTAYQRKTGYISLIGFMIPGYSNLFREVQEALYKYKGRPHWGKVNFLTKEQMPELYGDAYYQFIEAKKTLDPENRFSNAFSKRLFGE